MAMLQIDEEQLQEIVRQEISRVILEKEKYINSCIVDTVVNEIKKQVVINNKIEEYLNVSFTKEDSAVIGVIKNRVSKAVELYLIDKRHIFNNKVTDSIQKVFLIL